MVIRLELVEKLLEIGYSHYMAELDIIISQCRTNVFAVALMITFLADHPRHSKGGHERLS